MDLIDAILNLAGLLLWWSWQAIGITAATRPTALSLVSTLKRAEAQPPRRWTPLLILVVLLAGRSLFYWQVGAASRWQASLDLGAVYLHFRSDQWGSMLLYSLVSFGRMLGGFYLWLLLVAVANHRLPDSEPLQRLVRMQLGAFGRMPLAASFVWPLLGGMLLWLLLHWPASRLGLYGPPPAGHVLWQQIICFGLGLYLAWQYLAVGLLLIHFLNSYVYLGNSAIWHFLATTGRNLLRPFQWLPLTLGRFDTAPLIGIVLVVLAGHYCGRWLEHLFARPPL
jgi:uncharacterized protein YggT (Ycf19 family)